jgi:hypothetical protein
MSRRKSFEEMANYLRSIRPPGVEYLEFDRTVRLTMAWFDARPKLKTLEDKEQDQLRAYLTAELGHEPLPQFTPDTASTLLSFARATR